jgi:hypothetical protein
VATVARSKPTHTIRAVREHETMTAAETTRLT